MLPCESDANGKQLNFSFFFFQVYVFFFLLIMMFNCSTLSKKSKAIKVAWHLSIQLSTELNFWTAGQMVSILQLRRFSVNNSKELGPKKQHRQWRHDSSSQAEAFYFF